MTKAKPACVHVPPFAEREEKTKDGQTKVYCSKCGRFIGFRPDLKMREGKK